MHEVRTEVLVPRGLAQIGDLPLVKLKSPRKTARNADKILDLPSFIPHHFHDIDDVTVRTSLIDG